MFKRKLSILFYLSILVLLAARLWEYFFAVDIFYRDIATFAGLVVFAVWAGMYIWVIRKGEGFKKFRKGTVSLISVILIGAILSVLNILSYNNHLRVDVTQNKKYTLSEKTINILSNLKGEILVIGFFPEGSETESAFSSLLKEYSYHSRKITGKIVDPDKQPGEAKRYGVAQYNVIVFDSAEKETKVNSVSEEVFTNAIIRVTRKAEKVIYFVSGHGEKDINSPDYARTGYSLIKDRLEKTDYKVKSLNLYSSNKVPDDCTILIIAGPTADYMEKEIDNVKEFIERGGMLIMMIDPFYSGNILKLAESMNVIFTNNIVADEASSSLIGGDSFTSVVNRYENLPVISGFQLITFFPLARSVDFLHPKQEDADKKKENFHFKKILFTSSTSWIEPAAEMRQFFDPSKDVKGPACIGGVCYIDLPGEEKRSRIIAIGDSDFVSNSYVGLSGNKDLFLNLVNWLAEEEDLILIESKPREFRAVNITKSEGNIIFIALVIVMPVIILMTGTFIWIRRKRL